MRLTADLRFPLDPEFSRSRQVAAGRESFRQRLGYALMCLVVFEASLFGSGQMLRVGPLTVKMILFFLAVCYLILSLLGGDSLSYGSIGLVSSLFAVLVIAATLGLLHDGRLEYIYEDLAPLLYMLMLPFFEATLRSRSELQSALKIVLFSSLVLCLVYALILGALALGKVSPLELYTLFLRIGGGDFMYDGLTWRVFYKGSLYLGMAVIVFAFRRGRWARIGLVLCSVALVLTVTRGFVAALLFVGLIYAAVSPVRLRTKIAAGALIVAIGAVAIYVTLGLAGDKTESNSVRLITVQQVIERTDLASIVFGHGFGVGVPERPEHMEIAYLEIFYKQGLLGLIWYGSMAAVAAIRLQRAIAAGHAALAYPLFLTIMFVYTESLTNPFINNPIGLSMILICLAGLRTLTYGKEQKKLEATTAHV